MTAVTGIPPESLKSIPDDLKPKINDFIENNFRPDINDSLSSEKMMLIPAELIDALKNVSDPLKFWKDWREDFSQKLQNCFSSSWPDFIRALEDGKNKTSIYKDLICYALKQTIKGCIPVVAKDLIRGLIDNLIINKISSSNADISDHVLKAIFDRVRQQFMNEKQKKSEENIYVGLIADMMETKLDKYIKASSKNSSNSFSEVELNAWTNFIVKSTKYLVKTINKSYFEEKVEKTMEWFVDMIVDPQLPESLCSFPNKQLQWNPQRHKHLITQTILPHSLPYIIPLLSITLGLPISGLLCVVHLFLKSSLPVHFTLCLWEYKEMNRYIRQHD